MKLRGIVYLDKNICSMASLSKSYRPIRRDIAFGATCQKCNRALRSHTAYILYGEDDGEQTFGPSCAKMVLNEAGISALKSVPDYTAAITSPDDDESLEEDGTTQQGAREPVHREPAASDLQEIRYLLLRQRVLQHIPGASYQPLEKYVLQYDQGGTLSPAAVRHVGNIMRKHDGGRYGMRSLLTVHAYDAALAYSLSISRLKNNKFLNDIHAYLHRHLRLTPKQIDAADKDLPNGVSLDHAGFYVPERPSDE